MCQMLLRGPGDRDCSNEIGPMRPLLTLAGPVPWKGSGKPGCSGSRYPCKLSVVEEVNTLFKGSLARGGKRGHKVDGRILF